MFRFDHGLLSAVEAGESTSVEYFNVWTSEVKSFVPEDRLLVYQVSEGWKPLCQFLNLEGVNSHLSIKCQGY